LCVLQGLAQDIAEASACQGMVAALHCLSSGGRPVAIANFITSVSAFVSGSVQNTRQILLKLDMIYIMFRNFDFHLL
jgi:hypothetical protein